MRYLLAFAIVFAFVSTATAQPAHSCGNISNLSVTYDRDAAGFFPRMASGDQAQFDCITRRDPYFGSMRFDAGYKAANYFLSLLGQELGVSMQLLPAPSP